ncbi:hypothetical protein F5Y08DRAFT_91847 [Xylaria arbuscula]|nr:hypothetical protein F5Y08DRAFT_91847 [Xylaria arbuscula]
MSSSLLYSRALDLGPPLRDIFLSPLVSGPILLAVAQAPDVVQDLVSKLANGLQWLLPNLNLSTIVTALRILFAVSVVRRLNRALNTIAANSWRLMPSKDWDWPNEIAVVTGGSSGIGKLVVEKLVAQGLRVAVLDIQDIPKSMDSNTRIRFFRCDVTSAESVKEAADAVRRDMGNPSILINNAGITNPMPILQMSESYLRKIFGVNTISHWFTVQQFLPHMIEMNKGHVVTVASLASFVALPTAADYSASKASALAFHESLTSELKHCYGAPDVMTTVVHPNFVRTPLIEGWADHLENSGVRMLTSEDVAEPIVKQILSRRAAQIIIPRSTTMISAIRGWPTWIQELIRDTLGRSSLKP